MTNPHYIDLARAEEGSPEHLEAVRQIQAHERAAAKAQENVLKGDGRSGHAYMSYDIVPADAVPSNVDTYRGPMAQGEASPDLREGMVRIGDMETNREVAEAMRRTMHPTEWTALTGLPYTSLTQNQGIVQDKATELKAKLQPVQDQLEQVNAADELAKAEDDAERVKQEQELQSYEASLLEKTLEMHYGPDMTGKLQRSVVESGEVDFDSLSKLGVQPDMVEETVKHYTEAAERMLEPVGSCTAYAENFLSEAEGRTMRQAIVSRDLAKVQELGMRARDRAAAMDMKQITDFLTTEERMKLRVRQQGFLIMVDLPQVGTTSWANAVTQGLISFK
ncbi:hypothetical protein [Aestuariivirga sp.]|uniref:hypothetical protein n=1 Tax=Aestuariivirga sp. TaxID=2650926 RepID=UPI0039190781